MKRTQFVKDDAWNIAIEQLARLAEAQPADLIAASAHRCNQIAAWLRAQKR